MEIVTVVNASLYVGDLDGTVTEANLYELFSRVCPILSVRICRDQLRNHSLGYGYVNFTDPSDAARAMEMLNFTPINGKPIRIMPSQRDPTIRKSGYANVFIKNLDRSIDNKALLNTFRALGKVLSCKVAADHNGLSKGYGFVQFETEESAQRAITELNGMCINGKQVYVGLFVCRQERVGENGTPKFTNVYVKNLPDSFVDETLEALFSPFGAITSVVIMRDAAGKSRGFGFVNFQIPDGAVEAVQNMNGTTVDGKVLFVGRAQKKADREVELKARFEAEKLSMYEQLAGANLYLKNLDDSVKNEENLRDLFSEFGTITSCKVMTNPNGISKGSGFVAFSTPEEATKALKGLNGKMVGRKPLFVAVAQRKEERKNILQAQFAQMRSPGGMEHLPPTIPGFAPPGGPRLGHPQMYFGQGTSRIMPHQPNGYGFQPQLLPRMNPAMPPNFMLPCHLQRQGPRGLQHPPQQRPHHNFNYRGRYTPNGRNEPEPSTVRVVRGMPPLPTDGSVPESPIGPQGTGPVPIAALASALASANPVTQRMMLGEQLYPLVERLELRNVSKVTGMLLEMDQTEVLHLIEAPDALKDKVAEAMHVLRKSSAKSDGVDQIGSLTLDD